MMTINFGARKPEKNVLITVGHNSYYADEYIVMPDGLLLATINPRDDSQIILTKIDNGGFVITEFESGTTMEEFLELQDEMIDAMQKYVAENGECSCCDHDAVDDEDGEDISNPDFKTKFDPEDVNYR